MAAVVLEAQYTRSQQVTQIVVMIESQYKIIKKTLIARMCVYCILALLLE